MAQPESGTTRRCSGLKPSFCQGPEHVLRHQPQHILVLEVSLGCQVPKSRNVYFSFHIWAEEAEGQVTP